MISYFWLSVFLFLAATLHAKLEIEIEGKHGWATKLPTKKIRFPGVQYLSEHGYITGFHLYTVLLLLVFYHASLFFVEQWTWNYEFIVIGLLVLHFVVEDFLWFVLNPHYGIRKFSSRHIPWHTRWWLALPVSYWIALPIGLLLLFVIRV